MPYSVGLSIHRGLTEVSRIIIDVEAETPGKASLRAEDIADREYGPDCYSHALAVTEAYPAEHIAAA